MIQPQYILKSTKKVGKYEEKIIEKLTVHFSKNGFHVIPHARFDLAWGSILSDIDILLIKNNKLYLVEVKSSRDNLERAKEQIKRIEGFVDFIYLATDYEPRRWPSRKTGKIIISEENVLVLKEAKSLTKNPDIHTLMKLKKESLEMLLDGSTSIKNLSKYELASQILSTKNENLKKQIQKLITCQTNL